jgi:hypothetical protein
MTAIDRYVNEGGERRLAVVTRQSQILANSKLLPVSLRNKPEDVLAIAITLDQFGLPVSLSTLGECAVVNGRVLLSGQLMCALVAAQGHEVWFEERTPARAVVCGERADSARVHRLAYTRDMARESGAFDVWVERQVKDGTWGDSGKTKWRTERWVVGNDQAMLTPAKSWPEWATQALEAGTTKRNDTWWLYPESMLGWRALRRLLKVIAPDALMGLPAIPGAAVAAARPAAEVVDIDASQVDDPEGDSEAIAEAEVVPETRPGDSGTEGEEVEPSGESPAPSSPAPYELADDIDLKGLRQQIGEHDSEIRQAIAEGWTWGSVKEGAANPLAKADVGDAIDHVRITAQGIYDRRRKRANAVMGEADVKGDDARHELVSEATGGATSSTARLTAAQVTAIVDYCNKLHELDATGGDAA